MADETRMASMPGAMHSDDPEATRAEIEQTRRRMSTTIDELGDVLQRKKGQIQERLDVMAPVREHPLRTVGIVFGAGLVLGLLTGGGEEEEEEERGHRRGRHGGADAHWRRRAEMWEGRARRLLHIAREQDEELEEMRASHRPGRLRRALFEEDEHDHAHRRFGSRRHHEHEHEDESRFDELRDTVSHAVSGLLSNAVRQFARAMTA